MNEFPHTNKEKCSANKPFNFVHSELCRPRRTTTFSGKYNNIFLLLHIVK